MGVIRAILLTSWLFLVVACAAQPPPPPLAVCSPEEIQTAFAQTGDYARSSLSEFVQIENGQLLLGDAPYVVQGVNYYPSRYPWRRFLTETDTDTLQQEFALMQSVGFNTLRIFLWNEALFQCSGSGAIPKPENVQRLDAILRIGGNYGFRFIVTLNDLPDLEQYPLYSNPTHIQQQTQFLVERYRDEAAIFAWDLRNEGDIDYGTHHAFPAKASKEQVLGWLATTAQQVRALDSNHLITAGWLFDAEATAPYVDFVSFHHWTAANDLVGRIAPIRAATNKPILLQEVGYSTQRVTPEDQAQILMTIVEAVQTHQLLGWLIWTAFDFPIDRSCYPTPCQSPDNAEHYFGIWRLDYTEKPFVAFLRAMVE